MRARSVVAGICCFSLVLTTSASAQYVPKPRTPEGQAALNKDTLTHPGRAIFGMIGIGSDWFRSVPGYYDYVAWHVVDVKRISQFLNKYRKTPPATEDETTLAVIQLGIPQYAPQWLTPEGRQKVSRYLATHSVSYNSRPALTPVTYAFSPDSNIAPINIAAAGALGGAGEALFSAMGMAALADAVGMVFLIVAPVAAAIYAGRYLTDPAVASIKASQNKECAESSCTTTQEPQPLQIPDRNSRGDWAETGNCTPQDHNKLQAQVDKICGQPHSCKKKNRGGPDFDRVTPDMARSFIAIANQCIAARTNINNICYMGGNDNHRKAVADEENARDTCNEIINASGN